MAKESAVLTFQEALKKAEHYCAYQERCHFEVQQKLKEWGLPYAERDGVLAQLVQHDYLNEERFARIFSRSKFNQKRWGRRRITLELKQKRISGYCIRKGLEEIEEEAYLKGLAELAEKRWNQEKTGNKLLRADKVGKYLMGKGFESNLVWETLKDLGYLK